MPHCTGHFRKEKIEYEFKNDKSMLLALYIILFVTGIVLISVAKTYYDDTLFLLKNGINTKAIVSDIISTEDSDGDRTYKPVFTFVDGDGHTVSFQNPVSSNPVVWKRGEVVSIIYDPGTPSSAKVFSYWGLFRVSIICAMIAAPFLVVSLGYFIFLFMLVKQH